MPRQYLYQFQIFVPNSFNIPIGYEKCLDGNCRKKGQCFNNEENEVIKGFTSSAVQRNPSSLESTSGKRAVTESPSYSLLLILNMIYKVINI